jgi:hypothetical protein
MKKQSLLLTALALSVFCCYAQDLKKAQPDSLIKVIPVDEGRHYSFLYTIGGKLQTPEEVQHRLLNYAPSAFEVKASKRDTYWAFGLLAGTAAASVGAGYEFYQNSKSPVATAAFVNGQPGFTYTYPNNNKTGAYILTGLAIGFLTTAITTWINAAHHSKKAFDVYNQQFR